ncbi:MAG: arginine--tRNA ligase [Coriobacteriia bacterium]|nr:arginine--tRNA ligase [Coriobacteriia bacterium]
MRYHVETIVRSAIQEAADAGELALTTEAFTEVLNAAVERPRDASHGDWATTIALRLAKELGQAPRAIAEIIASHLQSDELIAAVEVAGPGFINLRLSERALQQMVRDAREQGSNYGRVAVGGMAGGTVSDTASGSLKTINVEFISANPTGPMHVGHGRWAALGNALCNVLEHAGWQVTREFYINDAGVQMDLFGASIVVRYLQLCGLEVKLADDHYAGSYITALAQEIFDAEGTRWLEPTAESDENWETVRLEYFREFGYQRMLENMKNICASLNVPFDVWFSERSLYEPAEPTGGDQNNASGCRTGLDPVSSGRVVDKLRLSSKKSTGSQTSGGGSPLSHTLAVLKEGGYLYEKDDATWFRTTDFGDDKDRVLIKADGSYTYFAPDIAYHNSKLERGSAQLINIWGADHHGYIKRMQAACTALGHEGQPQVVLGQLVNLFRGGEAVRMSKRTGEMVTFEELIEEVGADATKYLMLARSSDQPIDFDIEVAKKQDSSNPVYYVQYAHARICSLLRKAAEQYGFEDGAEATLLDTADLSLLVHPSELALARVLSRLSEVVVGCASDLAPFRLTHYAEELATAFHRFYTDCQVVGSDEEQSKARLYLADATRNVLAVTLGLLGVSAPQRM